MKSGDIRLEASQKLIELLSNIEHAIAYTLLDKIRYKEYQRVSYLDFGNESDNISYIINNKYMELVNNDRENWKEKVWSEKRTNLKIGKFVKMIFEDSFPINQPKDQQAPKPRVDIESFVNMFKAERDKNINYNRFEIVSGENIRKWYKQDNYSRFANQETPLGKSCMRYVESTNYLKMYSENPRIFRMLILKDDAGKLKGRALLWNLDIPEKRIFMDRIYTVNDYDIEIFKNYAREQGWMYRTEQRYGWFNRITDPTTNNIYESNEMLLQVTLDAKPEIDYEYYPYLDTLSVYNTNTHILSNNGELRIKNGHVLLTDYQGSYHSEVDERVRVFSTFYNENILEEDAIYVEIDDTWVYRGDEVYVHDTGGLYAYKRSPKIVSSNVLDKYKYFLKDDCTYSEYMGTHIFKKSVISAYLDDKKEKSCLIHCKLIGVEFIEKDGEYFYSKELKENYLKKMEDKKYSKKNKLSSELLDFNINSDSYGNSLNEPQQLSRINIQRLTRSRDVDSVYEQPISENQIRESSRRVIDQYNRMRPVSVSESEFGQQSENSYSYNDGRNDYLNISYDMESNQHVEQVEASIQPSQNDVADEEIINDVFSGDEYTSNNRTSDYGTLFANSNMNDTIRQMYNTYIRNRANDDEIIDRSRI